MKRQMGNALNPQDHIRRMFRQTQEGTLSIMQDSLFGEPEAYTYQVSWTEEDAEEIVQRYYALAEALERIGRLHDQLDNEGRRKELLSAAELAVWETYVRPYEPFEVDLSIVEMIHERGQLGDLCEEEEALWKRYCMWREAQSQERIPFHRRSAADMIQAARRYARAISLQAPETVVAEQGRCLAEEMVLYYAGKEEPLVWD